MRVCDGHIQTLHGVPCACPWQHHFQSCFYHELARCSPPVTDHSSICCYPFQNQCMIDAFSSNLSEDICLLLSCLHIHLCDFGDRPKIVSTTSSNWSSITVFKVCYIQPSDVFLGFTHVSNFLWLCEPTYITWTKVSSWVHGVITWVPGQTEG